MFKGVRLGQMLNLKHFFCFPSCSPNAVLRLRFNHFATECSWDHMYVYDGDSIYAPLVAVFRWEWNLSEQSVRTVHQYKPGKCCDLWCQCHCFSCSGLIVPEIRGNETVPEVETTSGYALLHFFSDAAYNLTGFEIFYSWVSRHCFWTSTWCRV